MLGFVAHGRQSDASVLWLRGRQCDEISVSVMRWALWPMAVILMHRFCGLVAVKCDVLSVSEMRWALWPMAVSLMHRFCGLVAVKCDVLDFGCHF